VFLLDTNVVSEQRKPKPHGAVIAWLAGIRESDLFISAMTIAEIQAGAERTRIDNPIKAIELESFLIVVVAASQVLPMDADVAREWARMMHRKPKSLESDCWIAATAKIHRLTVATRNTKDFAGFGVDVSNPFQDSRGG